MIEQSFEHGAVYLSEERTTILTSKPVKVTDIAFGPWRHIQIAHKDPFVYVKDTRTKTIYLYENKQLQITSDTLSMPSDTNHYLYYYGLANHNTDGEFPYYIQNRPQVSYNKTPDIKSFQLPRTLQDLGYDQLFTYPEEIKELLADVQATYVDRYKRPVHHARGRIFPINIDRVDTTVSQLEETNYPIVLNLEGTGFAMVDLEPGYTKEDYNHFEQLDGYYKESTPNGGKHLLVPANSKQFKFRYSEHLEIINEGMVSIYGINGKFLSWKPTPLDVSIYKATQRTASVPVTKRKSDKHIKKYVDLLNQQSEKTASSAMDHAKQNFNQNADISYAEYIAIYILYVRDILPYKDNLPADDLPWIVEGYANPVIPWRDKHETQRNNIPYLVHLANEVIQYREREAEKT